MNVPLKNTGEKQILKGICMLGECF